MSHANLGARLRRRWPVALVAVAAVGAAACGSGSGGSTATVSIHAIVRRTGCPVAAPRRGPYRGAIVFSASGDRQLLARLDRRGRAGLTMPPGRYRVGVSGQPRGQRLVGARLDGRALAVAGGGFPVNVGRGDSALLVVVAVRPADCNALGAGG